MKRLIFVFICFVVFLTSAVFGQRNISEEPKNKEDVEDVADIALQEGKFEKALSLYRQLLDENIKSARLNFLVGYCYLNTDYGLLQSIEHLTNAINLKSDPAPLESYYYLAKAYYLNNQFNLASDNLSVLFPKIPKNNKEFIAQANQLKELSENASMLSKSSAIINIENVFEINSKYSDLNPILYSSGQEIVFTSRKENPLLKKKMEDEQFDENIYYSKFNGDEWSSPYGISKTINSVNHESVCWISEQGNHVVFCRVESNLMKLYQSTKNAEGEWTVPMKLSDPVNDRSQQSFASISPDGKFIYFTSDRSGGYGGMDIYVAEIKGNNIYGTPKNLGPAINTQGNEESPVLHENGVLFFSSQGHISMGGFDIFATYKDKSGNWVEAFNMGQPLNSVVNDFFYKPVSHGQIALSSSERNGTKGKSDIFKISNADSSSNGYALIAGKIQFRKKIDANKSIEIKLENTQNNADILTLSPNSKGVFNFILPAAANYRISFLYKNEIFYAAKLSIAKSYSYLCMDQSINFPGVNLDLDTNLRLIKKMDLNTTNLDMIYSIAKSTELIKSASALALINSKSTDSTVLYSSITDNNYSNEPLLASDSIYSIKIVSSKSRIPLSEFTISDTVKEYIDSKGNYIYYTGSFNYEWEALIQLRLVKEKYPDAIIFVNDFVSELTN